MTKGFSALEMAIGPTRSKSIFKSRDQTTRVPDPPVLSRVVSTESEQISDESEVIEAPDLTMLTMTRQNAIIPERKDRCTLLSQNSEEELLTPIEKLNKLVDQLGPFEENLSFGSRY